jgi:class 3 adenylate cyclase
MPVPSDKHSKVLTLVFTDLANSTALKTQRGDTAVDEPIRRHRDLITDLATECAGCIIDWAGDGCFLTFNVSTAACGLHCAFSRPTPISPTSRRCVSASNSVK